jgi:outer membrane protein assembly factor BamB
MTWQRTVSIPTSGAALTALRRSGTWLFRGLYRAFAWRDGAAQLAWDREFPSDFVGGSLLAATDDVVVVASFVPRTLQTDFFALDIATGDVRWQVSREFRPANRRNTQSLATDSALVTCLGSNKARQFCMLRLDLASGRVVEERVLDVRRDVAITAEDRTFVGGEDGLFVFDGDRLERVLDGNIVELEPAGADLLVHATGPTNPVVSWLASSGESRGSVALERGLGVLRPTATSAGRALVMPQYRPRISLYDMASGEAVWTVGAEQHWEGHRAAAVDGRVLVHVEQPKLGLTIVALEAATGAVLAPPVDKIGTVQVFGAAGSFVIAGLDRLDIYRWT